MTLADVPELPLPALMVAACGVCGRELLHPFSKVVGICAFRYDAHRDPRLVACPPPQRWIAARSRTVVLCTEHQNVAADDGLCHRCVG